MLHKPELYPANGSEFDVMFFEGKPKKEKPERELWPEQFADDAPLDSLIDAEATAELKATEVETATESPQEAVERPLELWEYMDADQREGCVIQTSRGVSDVSICRSLGIDGDTLLSFRSTDLYVTELAKQASELNNRDLSIDERWTQLEARAIEMAEQRVRVEGNGLEMHELLQAARTANTAKRRHGFNSDSGKGKDEAGGVINITNNTVQLNMPSILLDRMRGVADGSITLQSQSDIEETQAKLTASRLTVGEVSSLLNVDLDDTRKNKVAENNANVMRGVLEAESDLIASEPI